MFSDIVSGRDLQLFFLPSHAGEGVAFYRMQVGDDERKCCFGNKQDVLFRDKSTPYQQLIAKFGRVGKLVPYMFCLILYIISQNTVIPKETII